MQHVGQDAGLGQQLAAALSLLLALLVEADVHPAGEQVQFVPLAPAVTEQDQGALRSHDVSLSAQLDASTPVPCED